MNDYYKVTFKFEGDAISYETDILASLLGKYSDFESFDVAETQVIGYVKSELYSSEKVNDAINAYPFAYKISQVEEFIPGEDWNSEWEKNYFKPISIDDRCVIHSSSHKDIPQCEYDIVINPKMAFGTGHHETTTLMIKQILDTDMLGLNVLDMGTGTGVLAILCAKRGAKFVKAVEIDEMAYENTLENLEINSVSNIVKPVCCDVAAIKDDDNVYDYILANINRNIIMEDIGYYAKSLKSGGYIQLSGFYTNDVPVIEEACAKYGLKRMKINEKNNWAMLLLQKI